jgi:hypothetical protein
MEEEQIYELKKKIRILEWDKRLNQINFSKIDVLKELKEKLEKMQSERV